MTLTCDDCGFEARAADQAGLVAAVRQHAFDVHGMELSNEEARALALGELGVLPAADREPRKEES